MGALLSSDVLVYVHIGSDFPTYISDSLFQSLIVSPNTKIYVIIEDIEIEKCRAIVRCFNNSFYVSNQSQGFCHIEFIPTSILHVPEEYTSYVETLPKEIQTFRSSFWIATTKRFFYLLSFLTLFKISRVFHIENDVMLFSDLNSIEIDRDKIYFLRHCDNPPKVIPSIIYIPSLASFERLITFMLGALRSGEFQNDMQLLGAYTSEDLAYFPSDWDDAGDVVMDGAAIGQFLGGIDPRNLANYSSLSQQEKRLVAATNPSKGFVNTEAKLRADQLNYFTVSQESNRSKLPLNFFYASEAFNDSSKLKKVTNLHVHSKQLSQFSSINSIKFQDIISGERYFKFCDFIICTENILKFHINIDLFTSKDLLIIVDENTALNFTILNETLKSKGKSKLRLFIYTHLSGYFVNNILGGLNKDISYTLYFHNSDDSISEKEEYDLLINSPHIDKVFSQNICFPPDNKFNLLPIGIANSMWAHGDILSVHETRSSTYYLKKTKGLYININESTHPYRHVVMSELRGRRDAFNINASSIPYADYLKELASHRFCLCLQGHGISCHREWESLYLGCIPVIVNNKYTSVSYYVAHLRKINIPFLELTDENMNAYSDDFFSEALYAKIITDSGQSIYNLSALKIDSYKS